MMKQRAIAIGNPHQSDEALLVSRLMDDDLTSDELAVLLDSMGESSEMRASWGSYNLISATLQGHHAPDTEYRGFSSRIAAAIDAEPTVLAPQRRRWMPGHTSMKRVAGVAIAAGVTALTIGGVQQWDRIDSGATPMVVASQSPQSHTRPVPAQRAVVVYYSSPSHQVAAQPQHNYPDAVNQHALGAYLVNHNEYSPSAGMHGVLPYARIVSHENR